jgi:hypothetical protein
LGSRLEVKFIERIEVGSTPVAALEFAGIPSDGSDLCILLSARSSSSGVQPLNVTINNITSSTYDYTFLYSNGSNTQGNSGNSTSWNNPVAVTPSTFSDGLFSNSRLYFPGYSASQAKGMLLESVIENASTSSAYLTYSYGHNSGAGSAISSIKLATGGNFVQYTTASLYILS